MALRLALTETKVKPGRNRSWLARENDTKESPSKPIRMTTIECRYSGNLHCDARHGPSGQHLQTDAPKDHDGLGQTFSPTDLLATSLGTCVLTVIGITAKRRQWNVEGASARVTKMMTSEGPRKIACLKVDVHLPQHCSPDQRRLLMRMAEDCPVKRNLEGALTIELNWT